LVDFAIDLRERDGEMFERLYRSANDMSPFVSNEFIENAFKIFNVVFSRFGSVTKELKLKNGSNVIIKSRYGQSLKVTVGKAGFGVRAIHQARGINRYDFVSILRSKDEVYEGLCQLNMRAGAKWAEKFKTFCDVLKLDVAAEDSDNLINFPFVMKLSKPILVASRWFEKGFELVDSAAISLDAMSVGKRDERTFYYDRFNPDVYSALTYLQLSPLLNGVVEKFEKISNELVASRSSVFNDLRQRFSKDLLLHSV